MNIKKNSKSNKHRIGAEQQGQRRQHHQRDVVGHIPLIHFNRAEYGHTSYDHQNVKNIASYHIADGQSRTAMGDAPSVSQLAPNRIKASPTIRSNISTHIGYAL